MRDLLVAVTSFGAAGLELAEAGLLLLVVVHAGHRRAALWGAAVGGLVVLAGVAAVGIAVIDRLPVTEVRLFLGVGLVLIGGSLWLRALLRPSAGADELRHETEQVRRQARGELGALLASAKVVLIEGGEAAILTVGIGAPRHALVPAIAGTTVAAVAVTALVVFGARALRRLAADVLDRLAGSALLLAGALWITDATGSALPVLVVLVVLVLLWTVDGRRHPRSPLPARREALAGQGGRGGDR